MSEVATPIFVSSGAFKSRSVAEIVGMALAGGLRHIELGSGTDWAPDVLQPVRKTAGRMIQYLVHNYFPPHETPFVLNLAAADEAVLARSREHCRLAIELSVEVGAPFFSVHAGFAFAAKPDDLGKNLTGVQRFSLERAHQTFVESLRELCAFASNRGMRVVVENNVIAPFNLVGGMNRLGLCATAEDIRLTHADVGSPNLGFLIDVGHLKVTANALGFDREMFLDKVGPHVTAFHLSDNDGMADQNLPFGDDAWFLPVLADFPDVTVVLEAYQLELDQIRNCCKVIDRARSRVKTV